MSKYPFIFVGLCIAGVGIGLILWFVSPFIRDGFHTRRQMQELQSRNDYPQLAATCLRIVHSVTNEEEIPLSDSRVSDAIRSLSPFYILTESNYLNMEFHGGFVHYGYRLQQSSTNTRCWNFSYYTEDREKLLTTITED